MLKNVSVLGLARVLPLSFAFVQSIVVARALGPEAFGAIALIAAYPTLVIGFLSVRSTETTTRFLVGYATTGQHVRALALCKVSYAVDVGIGVLALLVVLSTASWVAPTFLSDQELAPLVAIFGLTLVPNALVPTSVSILSVTGRFTSTAAVEVAGSALRTGLVIVLVLTGFGVPGVVYGMLAGNSLLGMAMLATAHRVAAHHWGGTWLKRSLADLHGQRREIARLFVLSDLIGLFGVVIKTADVLLLAQFRPTVEVGYYNLGKSLANQLLSLVGVIRLVSLPEIVRLWSTGAWQVLWSYVRRHTVLYGLPGLLGVAVLGLFIDSAILLVYGPPFLPATFVTRLLLMQVAFALLIQWVDMISFAWGDLHVRAVARGLGAVVTVAGIYLFAEPWGIAAAAVALLCQQVLSILMTTGWMLRQTRQRALEASDRSRARAGHMV